MGLITEKEKAQLLANGKQIALGYTDGSQYWPVVKLKMRGLDISWLFVALKYEDHDLAMGILDWGYSIPTCGYFRLSSIESLYNVFFVDVERDNEFRAEKTIGDYMHDAILSLKNRPYGLLKGMR